MSRTHQPDQLAWIQPDKAGVSPPNGDAAIPDSKSGGVQMRDVAEAAGVSVSTVLNVINHPHRVTARTRDRVESAVHDLHSQPDQHAKALRLPGSGAGTSDEFTSPASGEPPSDSPPDASDQYPQAPVTAGLDLGLVPGEHVTVRVGAVVLSGTVDSVMPDGSYFWIWADDGTGRRMIEAGDATIAGETDS